MARLWTCGFELQSAAAGVEILSVTGTPTISTTVHRAGAASLRINPSAATQYAEQQITGGVVGRYFHRFYLRIATLPAATTPVYAIGQSGYFPCYLRLTATGTLRLHDAFLGADAGTASAALTVGQWYRIEIDHTDVAGAESPPGTRPKGDVIAYVDGSNFSGTAQMSNINGFSRIRMGAVVAGTMDVHIDDVAVNDTTGSVQAGLPGAGNVVHLRPDSAGDNAGWATVVGGTANWQRVGETTPDDATTYNATVATGTTTIDDHNMGSTSAAGVSGERVTLVQVGGRIGSDAATAASLVYRVKSQAAGTVLESGSVSVALNGWATHKAAAPFIHQLTSYTDPQAGGVWTTALLDSAQIGYRGNVSQATTRRVSALWALVETVPVTTVALGTASETDTAQTVGKTKSKPLALSTETGATQALARSKAKALGASSETDAAQTLARHKARALTTANETDTAQAPTRAKLKTLPLATSTETAQSLAAAKRRTLVTATETDTAQLVTRSKTRAVAMAAEAEAAQPVGQLKSRVLGPALDTGTALPLMPVSGLQIAEETGAARALGRVKSAGLSVASAVESARPLGLVKTRGLAVAAETVAGMPLPGEKSRAFAPAEETEAARPLVGAKAQALPVAQEASGAQQLATAGRAGQAQETDTARPLTGAKTQTLTAASETATGLALAGRKGQTPGHADTTDTALLLGRAKAQALGTATAFESARPVSGAKGLTLGVASETGRALIGPKIRLTPAVDVGLALVLVVHRQQPADELTPGTSGPSLAVGTTGPQLTTSSNGPRLAAAVTRGG